jgi:hypothetical protein
MREAVTVPCQRLDQRSIDSPVRPRHGLGAGPLDDGQRRQDDAFLAQHFKGVRCKDDRLVGLHSQVGQAVHQLAKIG